MSAALENLVSRLKAVKRSGDSVAACCPAHDDQRASLSLTTGGDGRVLVRCHAGCTTQQIVEAVGLTARDLFPADASPAHGAGGSRVEVAAYDYRDEADTVLYQVVRFDPKDFRQRKPDGSGGWTWKLNGTRRVLYRLADVTAAAQAGRVVFVVEGEKDVHALSDLGLVATTNAGGAGKWRDEYSAALAGAHVAILPDNDEPGESHALAVARSVAPNARSVRIVRLPNLPAKGDVSDWLRAGGDRATLERLVSEAPLFTEYAPSAVAISTNAHAAASFIAVVDRRAFDAEIERNRAPVRATPTGFQRWNDACRDDGGREGLARGWHVVLAGRPGHGKSIMALNLARAALVAGTSVAFVSLEMSRHQLLTRMLAIATRTEIASIERGPHYREADYRRSSDHFLAMQTAHRATFTILDRPPCDWTTLHAAILQGIAGGAGLVIVDYLQLVTMPGAEGTYETTRQVSAAIRRLAVEHDVTTLALSQFNRASTFNAKEPPTMHGLAGGSALENDADQVALLDHSDDDAARDGPKALKLDKNRHGPLVRIPIVRDAATLCVREADGMSRVSAGREDGDSGDHEYGSGDSARERRSV